MDGSANNRKFLKDSRCQGSHFLITNPIDDSNITVMLDPMVSSFLHTSCLL